MKVEIEIMESKKYYLALLPLPFLEHPCPPVKIKIIKANTTKGITHYIDIYERPLILKHPIIAALLLFFIVR